MPRMVRADCGTENVLVAEIQRELLGDDNSFIYGRSTSYQLLEEEEHLRKDNALHRFCLQYSFMAFINRQLEEVRTLWNNHSIRRQKMGKCVPGIPEILHNESDVFGEMNYLQPIPNVQNYIQRCTADFDEDSTNIPDEIIAAYGLPRPEVIPEFSSAAYLFVVLSDVMLKIIM